MSGGFPIRVNNKAHEGIIVKWFSQDGSQNLKKAIASNDIGTIAHAYTGMELFASKERLQHQAYARVQINQPTADIYFDDAGGGLGEGAPFQERASGAAGEPVQHIKRQRKVRQFHSQGKGGGEDGFVGKEDFEASGGSIEAPPDSEEFDRDGQGVNLADLDGAGEGGEGEPEGGMMYIPELGGYVNNVPPEAMKRILAMRQQRQAMMQQQQRQQQQSQFPQQMALMGSGEETGKLEGLRKKIKMKYVLVVVGAAVVLYFLYQRFGNDRARRGGDRYLRGSGGPPSFGEYDGPGRPWKS